MLKELFLDEVKLLCGDDQNVAVALSSGKDSMSIMFALIALGKKVTAYTFYVENINSTDFVVARENCKILGVDFVECVIPQDVRADIVVDFIRKFERKKKVEVECIYPYYYLLPKVEQNILFIGLGAGHCIPLSKKVMIHYAKDVDLYNAYRLKDYEVTQKDVVTLNDLSAYLKSKPKVVDPFLGKACLDYFLTKSHKDMNTPKQKQILLDMFPDSFSVTKSMKQMNLQCGDSGIRDIFTSLLSNESLNTKKRKRVVDLYKDIYLSTKGEI